MAYCEGNNKASGRRKSNRQRRDTQADDAHHGVSKSGGRGCWNRKTTADSEDPKCWGGPERQAERQGRYVLKKTRSDAENKNACPGGDQKQGQADGAAKKKASPGEGQKQSRAALADITEHLIKSGVYEEYRRWREGYRRWREGEAQGACGEGCGLADEAATTDGPLLLSQSWRDEYRSWRMGGARGARGEMEARGGKGGGKSGRSRSKTEDGSCSSDLPPVIYDVVAGEAGEPALVPVDGPEIAPMAVKDFPTEAVLTVRVFRFIEDRSDASADWEKSLVNVNSGSIFWLPWQLAPNMHSKAGAKYGTWFTIHYVQVYAKHFDSAYHMCNEGCHGGAKTFGSSRSNSRAITGESVQEDHSYFWYVSPAAGKEHLRSEGWRHLDCEGPFDGSAFLQRWQEQDSPMGLRALQGICEKVVASAEKCTIK